MIKLYNYTTLLFDIVTRKMLKVDTTIDFATLQAEFTKLVDILYFQYTDIYNHDNQWKNSWYYMLYPTDTPVKLVQLADTSCLLQSVITKIELLQHQKTEIYVSFRPELVPAKSPEMSGIYYRITDAQLHLATDFQTIPVLVDYDFYADASLKENYIFPFVIGQGRNPTKGYRNIESFRKLGWIDPRQNYQNLQFVVPHVIPTEYVTPDTNTPEIKSTELTVEQKNIYSSDYLKMIDKIIDSVIENIKKHPRYNNSYSIQIEYAYNKFLPKNLLPTLVKKAQQCDRMMTNMCAVIKNINMDKIEELDKLLTEFLLVNEYKYIAKQHVCVMFDINVE